MMRRLASRRLAYICVLALGLLACACASMGESAPVERSPSASFASSDAPVAEPVVEPVVETVSFTFGWKVPSAVQVTERVETEGGTAVLRYWARLAPDAAGSHLSLTLSDFVFLEIDGEPIDAPDEKERVRALLQRVRAVPRIVLSEGGAFVDIEGMDERIETVLSLEGDPDEETARVMRSPEMRQMLIEKSREFWVTWVEAWRGLSLALGEHRSLPSPDGEVSLHFTSYHNGLAKLEKTLELDPEALRREVSKALAHMAAGLGEDASQIPPLDDVRRTTRYRVETDPRTLMPRRALVEHKTTLTLAGEPHEQIERHAYVFDWESDG